MSGIALLVLILAGLVICVLVLRSVRLGSVQIDVIPRGDSVAETEHPHPRPPESDE
ncbi:hypothetical protein GZH49_34040 [Nocardia terpenica]|uniref:hypothetical protein n=1 Tax=Nocardia terpenica TaxID=455432 RepID=UPI002FE03919